MRIAVMGSGGIGGYLGARLAQAGEDVIFIARGSHLEAMQQKGLRVESPLGEVHLRHVRATETPADVGFVDIVVFAVKAYDTPRAKAKPNVGSAEPSRSLSFPPPWSKRRSTVDCLAALESSV
jgi:2-dehydropantoate 2-reductase